MKELKDYLHLYFNSEVKWRDYYYPCFHCFKGVLEGLQDEVKLVLRPLSDMTSAEYDEWASITPDYSNDIRTSFAEMKVDAKRTHFLLSKHFDLFELIEAGLAIDKTTLKTTTI